MKGYVYNPIIEYMDSSHIASMQSELLRKQLEYVWLRVPLYRERMQSMGLSVKDIRGIEDIGLLPFTDKNDLKCTYPVGFAAAREDEIIRINGTSGTTDRMTLIASTKKDIELLTEGMSRAYAMLGCKAGFKVQNTFGYSMFIGGLSVQSAVENLGGTVIPTSTGNTKRQLRLLKDLQADNLSCTPSYAFHLSQEAEREGYTKADFALKNILTAGERLSGEVRDYVKNFFGVPIFDMYGSAEMTNVFASCEFDMGKHIPEDIIYAEIVDENGKALNCGECGELVITTLQKTGMPVIRYKTHDLTVMYDTPCACGRTGRRLGEIYGRTDDMTVVRGCKIYPSQIAAVLGKHKEFTGNFLIKVFSDDKIEIRIQTKSEIDCTEIERKIAEDIASVIGLKVCVSFTKNGIFTDGQKYKTVVDYRKNRFSV